jgi:hypothetical protein
MHGYAKWSIENLCQSQWERPTFGRFLVKNYQSYQAKFGPADYVGEMKSWAEMIEIGLQGVFATCGLHAVFFSIKQAADQTLTLINTLNTPNNVVCRENAPFVVNVY